MEPSLTRAPFRRGSDAESNDGFLVSQTPRLAPGNGSKGACGRIPVAKADRPLLVQSRDVRGNAGQLARRAQGRFGRARRGPSSCGRTDQPHQTMGVRTAGSCQLVEQGFCVLQVGGVEALGKRAVDGCEQVARLAPPALVAPQPGEARGGAQFVAPRALLAGDREGGAERVLGLGWIGVRQASGELAAHAVNFCVPAPLAGDGRFRQCVVQGGKGVLYFSVKRQRLGKKREK